MDGITIGQIAITLAYIAGIIGSIGVIGGVITKIWNHFHNNEKHLILEEMENMEKRILSRMEESDKAINERIDSLGEDVSLINVSQCKSYLVRYLADVERGIAVDVCETERAYEVMDIYTNKLHQNSYIHKRWEEVMEKDKRNKE
jgi:hypothetical protein